MKKKGADPFVSMNAALQRQCGAIQKLLAEAAVSEIDSRFKVGVIVRSILEAEGTYGERAVERVAEVLGREAGTLYRYASVARTWSEPEMRGLSRRPNSHGEPLSWSHWVELARAPATWRQWLERALAGSWPVRRLSRELDAKMQDWLEADAGDTTCAALLEAVKHAERLNAEMKAFGAVLDRLARTPGPPREVEELLARVRKVFRDVAQRSGDLLARVSEVAPEKTQADGYRRQVEMDN
jgi:hypothetical protein